MRPRALLKYSLTPAMTSSRMSASAEPGRRCAISDSSYSLRNCVTEMGAGVGATLFSLVTFSQSSTRMDLRASGMKILTAGLRRNSSSCNYNQSVTERTAMLVDQATVQATKDRGFSHLGRKKQQSRGISKQKKRVERHTLSMPSISRALFVPLGGGGGATELLSSLPLAEEPGASDPRPRFLVAEAIEGLPEAARRCASMSFLRLAANSLFSSVSLRMRSCETQSSHLQRWLACRLRSYAVVFAV